MPLFINANLPFISSWSQCLMSKIRIMEVTVPVPAPRAPRAQRYLAVSLAPAVSPPFSLTKRQARLKWHLQSFVQVSEGSFFSACFIVICRDANSCYPTMLLWMEFIICFYQTLINCRTWANVFSWRVGKILHAIIYWAYFTLDW